ncbi:MAG: uroporphyrinogen-III C-methyltransferase [Chloroflexota bacterium]|nr:uroporphyrinogen-III C-methyltransferase [Chloroflexota bacterium]
MTRPTKTKEIEKVFLVGAGPGDPGMLTIRGREVLSLADVVIHDRLVGRRIIESIPAETKITDVGKRPGGSGLTQNEINRLIISEASLGLKVVRLKGGDPFVFGRGGEEAIALAESGIPFEIVPGVTSAIAAPASAGIPVTHRGYAASFTVVTASEDFSNQGSSVNWEYIASGNQTIVVLMGSKQIGNIAKRLIKGGRQPDTPAAIIQSATLPMQKEVIGTLVDIERRACLAGLTSPSTFIVGEVVNISQIISIKSSLPLYGKRILVTRSRAQAGSLTKMLTELGAVSVEIPVIASDQPDDFNELDSAISQLARFQWLVLASVTAVEFFFDRLKHLSLDTRHLSNVKVASIGPATRQALKDRGIEPDFVPDRAISSSLVEGFKREGIRDCAVLLPSAEKSPDTIRKGLTGLGCDVTRVTAYKTTMPEGSESLVSSALREGIDMVTFTSSSTVTNLASIAGGVIDSKVSVACIGPVTADTARQFGLCPDIVSDEHTIKGLVSAIVSYYEGR